LEPFLFCLNFMDQRFHPVKNKSSKLFLLRRAHFA
jgi:hypothetical protein